MELQSQTVQPYNPFERNLQALYPYSTSKSITRLRPFYLVNDSKILSVGLNGKVKYIRSIKAPNFRVREVESRSRHGYIVKLDYAVNVIRR
jgi:hypothetical protein